ncbi:MAG: hypothetical protein IT372_08740 [Polyangiaceae bacterium]|nr:hypothetical protein [Polyangiaceae bacterium]
MMRNIVPALAAGVVLVALGGCGEKQAPPPAVPAQPAGEGGAPGAPPAPPAEPPPPAQGQPAPQGARPQEGQYYGYPGEQRPRPPSGPMMEEGMMEAPQAMRTFAGDVRALANAPPESASAQGASAAALRSLAVALRAVPGASGRIYSAAIAIEAQADRIDRAAPGGPAQVDATKTAISEALDALESVQEQHPSPELRQHVLEGRAASDRVTSTGSFPQERSDILTALMHVSEGLSIIGSPEEGEQHMHEAP